MRESELGTERLGVPAAASGGFTRRISWAAVAAGVLVTLAVQLFLGIIGVSIGAGTIEPLSETYPFASIGLGAGIWFALSTLIALYLGGMVAGRMAGIPRKLDGTLHGVLTWCLATLITTYFLTSAAGGLISGTAGLLGRTVSAIGSSAGSMGAALVEEGKDALAARGIGLDDIRKEGMALLRDTGKPGLQPETIGAATSLSIEATKDAAVDAAKAPGTADAELSILFDRLKERGSTVLEAADKEALVNVLVARTTLTEQQAEATVSRWQVTLTDVSLKFEAAKAEAEQQARIAGDKVATVLAKTAAWTAVIMALGALAAAFGGFGGTPRELLSSLRFRRLTTSST